MTSHPHSPGPPGLAPSKSRASSALNCAACARPQRSMARCQGTEATRLVRTTTLLRNILGSVQDEPRCEPYVWYIYLQNWVILFGQMLVNIPAPWSIWEISPGLGLWMSQWKISPSYILGIFNTSNRYLFVLVMIFTNPQKGTSIPTPDISRMFTRDGRIGISFTHPLNKWEDWKKKHGKDWNVHRYGWISQQYHWYGWISH